MKMIAMIAAAAIAALTTASHAGEPTWQTVGAQGAVNYRVNIGSIERKLDRTGLPIQANILIYRDAGGPQDPNGFHIVGFDCQGRWLLFDDIKDVHTVDAGSVVSHIEDIACWGPTR